LYFTAEITKSTKLFYLILLQKLHRELINIAVMRQNKKKQIDKKLTKKEFISALKKGLGRAFLHVSKYGLENIADLVLNACLHNQNYDTQCEFSRANWLFDMIKDKAEYPAIRNSILKALETEKNDAELYHLCHIAKEMALNGDREIKRILKRRVLKSAKTTEEEYWGIEDFIEVYGNSAVLDLAKIYGKRLLKNPKDYIPDGRCIREERETILIEQSRDNPQIKAYLDYLNKRNYLEFRKYKDLTSEQRKRHIQKRRRQFRQKYPLKKIIEDARNGIGDYPGNYVDFGHYATNRELEKICDLILTETDENMLTRLLWIFRRTSLPVYSPKYFKWANGKHKGLRSACIAALAQVPDEKVHKLARTKAKTGQILGADSEALDLFIENYTSRDAKIIMNALNSVKPNRDEAHDFSHSIINLTDNYKDPQLTDILMWVYEKTPCTMCREDVVETLYELGKLDVSILNECLYDANEDIREFARKLSRQAGNK
jgi:hypothetical protein